jgi:hypothetical protein
MMVGKVHDAGMRAFFEVWFGLVWEEEQSIAHDWVMTMDWAGICLFYHRQHRVLVSFRIP